MRFRRSILTATAAATSMLATICGVPNANAAQPRAAVVQPTTDAVVVSTTKRKRAARALRRATRVALPARGYWRRHSGYRWARWAGDINVPGWSDYGNPVRSRWSGRVVRVRKLNYSYGWHIIVRHWNGRSTLYAHLSKILVKPGQRVQIGQLIGRVGNTGNSSGPHLHFEIR